LQNCQQVVKGDDPSLMHQVTANEVALFVATTTGRLELWFHIEYTRGLFEPTLRNMGTSFLIALKGRKVFHRESDDSELSDSSRAEKMESKLQFQFQA
jgi:hypothetical protein